MHSSTQDVRLGAEGERVVVEAITSPTPATSAASTEAGLGVDRADWPAQIVRAPNDVTTTLHSSSRLHRLAVGSARQRGDWPGATDAVTLDLKDTGPLAEAVPAPALAIVDILLAPFRSHDRSVAPYQRLRSRQDDQSNHESRDASPTSEDTP